MIAAWYTWMVIGFGIMSGTLAGWLVSGSIGESSRWLLIGWLALACGMIAVTLLETWWRKHGTNS